jgi:predicted anti-sigma-YlaC factor YlaD
VTRFALPQTCERARQWASLGLDGELSELERALLAAHLDSCVACADFVRDVRASTRALRTSPLARPLRPVVLPRRRSVALTRVLPAAAAAAVAATAVGLGVVLGSAGHGARPATGPSMKAPLIDDNKLLRVPRLAQLVPEQRTKQRGLGILV